MKMRRLHFIFFIILQFPILTFSQTWEELNHQLTDYYTSGDYENGIKVAKKCLQQAEKEFGKNHENYANTLNDLAFFILAMGNYLDAEPLLVQVISIRKNILGENHPDYATSLYTLAVSYYALNQYVEAEPLFVEAMNIRKKVLGEEHLEYVNTLFNLARLYRSMNSYKKAAPLLVEAMNIRKKVLGENHPDYVNVIAYLSSMYIDMGKFEEAEPLLIQEINIRKKLLGEGDPNYYEPLFNLAFVYYATGNYTEAEPLYVQAIAICEKVNGENHPDCAWLISNLADLYRVMGRPAEEVEPLLAKGVEINRKIRGVDHIDYANSLSMLATFYLDNKRLTEAETLYVQALKIYKNAMQDEDPNYSTMLNNLVALYIYMSRYAEAEPLQVQAINIHKKTLGTDHLSYTALLNTLAILYDAMGRYSEAESLLVQAVDINKKMLMEDHPNYSNSLNNLGLFYYNINHYSEAAPFFVKALITYRNRFVKTFSCLNEKEQNQFLQTVSGNFKAYQSFGLNYTPASKLACNSELLIKGLLLESSSTTRERIWASGDTSLIHIYNQFLGARKMLSEQYSKPVSERLPDLEQYEQQANELEKKMVAKASQLKLPGFDDYGAAFRVTWEDVQQSLKPGEAAIEFSHFQYYDKRWTDSIYYSAYIIRPGDTLPLQIFLFEERQLDSLLSSSVVKDKDVTQNEKEKYTIHNLYSTDAALYVLVWKKLERHLKGVNTIYYAPAGNLNKISFAAVSADDKQTLSDKYNLVTLSSTRELTGHDKSYTLSDATGIALFGGILYDVDTAQMKNISAQYQTKPSFIASRSLPDDMDRGEEFGYLKGTLKEVQTIQSLFKNNQTFTGKDATEEAFKSLQSEKAPDVLHIATHGFFYREDTVRKDHEGRNIFQSASDPLLRSGLVLAGGNLKWNGEPVPKDIEDGILTAKEVASMNLNNTKLTVLSACETGLGDIKGSEGVYGLQRAFKAAGVDYLIMSLWKVPDAATQDFMTTFYRHCTSSKDIQTAFRLTQSEMKSKYIDPYKWAAFVLVR